MAKKQSFIAIAGNIGAGKTTLTEFLANHYKWQAFFENVDGNPYLSDFYEDMRRWSFNLQIYFLSKRFDHHQEMLAKNTGIIQDRTIYEDVEIFAKNLNDMGLMSDRDFQNYSNLFQSMESFITPPTLLIYLRAQVPTLVKQIQKRGRDYENTIRIDYLERLNEYYEDWIQRYPHQKLIIDTDDLDFVGNDEDLGMVVSLIDKRLHGLFED